MIAAVRIITLLSYRPQKIPKDKKMENKKEYVAPQMDVVELKYEPAMLLENSDALGLAPHEQDPIA